MLGHDHEQSARVLVDQGARATDAVDEVESELFGLHGVACLDVHDGADHVCGHDAVRPVEAVFGVERRPRALLLVLRDAGRVLRRCPLSRLVELVGMQAEDVDAGEPDRSADRRVGTESGPEDVALAVEADLLADGAVDDEERCRARRALPDSPGGVRLLGDRLPCRQHHREVLGAASGHGGVDRGQAHSEMAVQVGDGEEDFFRIARHRREELVDVRLRRGNDRQPVGPLLRPVVLQDLAHLVGVDLGWRHFFFQRRCAHLNPPLPESAGRRASRSAHVRAPPLVLRLAIGCRTA